MVRVIPPYPNFDASDVNIAESINSIYSQYGDTVSVVKKAKSLNKFGRNQTVGTAFETVSYFQGTTANETFVSTNIIDSISSSASADTSKTYTIEGHTIDGSGNLTFVSQNATTDASDGQTKVALTTPLARANRMFLAPSGTFNSPQTVHAGIIYVYDDTDGISAGVPSTAAATKIALPAGETQSEKAATSVSSVDYWIITGISVAIADAGGAGTYATFRMEIRDVFNGGVWRELGRDIIAIDGAAQPDRIEYVPYLIVPKNHDWRIKAKMDSNTAPCFAEASGYLAVIV